MRREANTARPPEKSIALLEEPLSVIGQAFAQGAVYLYDVMAASATITLTAPNPRARQRLGFAVALAPTDVAADTLIAGAPGREQALIFRRTNQQWQQTDALDASPEVNRAAFGAAVATTGAQHVVGIRGLAQDVGAAYFFADK